MKGTGKFTFYYLIVKSFKELNIIAVLFLSQIKTDQLTFFCFWAANKKKMFYFSRKYGDK